MSGILVIAALGLVSAGAVLARRSHEETALRTTGRALRAFLLLLLACFGAFGFFASYEYAAVADRLPWQIGYGLVGVGAFLGAVRIAFGHRRKIQR